MTKFMSDGLTRYLICHHLYSFSFQKTFEALQKSTVYLLHVIIALLVLMFIANF